MVREVLSRVYKSFLSGSGTKIFIELYIDGEDSLKAELVGIQSNRSERLKQVILKLSSGSPKVTCSPPVARAIAKEFVVRDKGGLFKHREWTVTQFDQKFSVHCQRGKKRFEATAILRKGKQQAEQLAECA